MAQQKERKPKFSFSNTWALRSKFVGYRSFLELGPPDINPLRETSLEKSIDSSNLSVRGYPAFVRKDFVTHKHDLVVRTRKVVPFPCDYFLEN